MRRFATYLVVGPLPGGLVATNPGMDAFATFVGEQSERILRAETGDALLGRVIAGAGAGLASSYVDRVTTRQSYLLFSTYTLDLDGTPDDGDYATGASSASAGSSPNWIIRTMNNRHVARSSHLRGQLAMFFRTFL